jgi:hypothetical protein
MNHNQLGIGFFFFLFFSSGYNWFSHALSNPDNYPSCSQHYSFAFAITNHRPKPMNHLKTQTHTICNSSKSNISQKTKLHTFLRKKFTWVYLIPNYESPFHQVPIFA